MAIMRSNEDLHDLMSAGTHERLALELIHVQMLQIAVLPENPLQPPEELRSFRVS